MRPEHFRLNYDIELDHWWFVARRRILQELIAQIVPASPETLIVDVGCGTGGNTGALNATYTCVGIDPSPEAIQLARSRFPQVRFLCGEAPQDLGELAGRADLFLVADVLEHVPDDFAFLSGLLSAARPGAYVLLTVPADPSLWSPHDVAHEHYRRYDMERLARLWRDLPVSLLLASYYNARLCPIIRLIRRFNQWRSKASGEAGTDLKMPSAVLNRMLLAIFEGEARTLLDVFHGRRRCGYPSGASLIAVLRREPGTIAARGRPDDVAADCHDPAAARMRPLRSRVVEEPPLDACVFRCGNESVN